MNSNAAKPNASVVALLAAPVFLKTLPYPERDFGIAAPSSVGAQLYPERKRRNPAPQLAQAYTTCREAHA